MFPLALWFGLLFLEQSYRRRGVPNLERHFDFRFRFLEFSHDWRAEYFLVDFWGNCVVVFARQFGRGALQQADCGLQGCRVNSFASLSAIFWSGVLPSSCWAVEAMGMHIAQPIRMAFLKNGSSLQRLWGSTASSWAVRSASMSLIFFFVLCQEGSQIFFTGSSMSLILFLRCAFE